MKTLSFVLFFLVGLVVTDGYGQEIKTAEFGKGASLQLPSQWRILDAPDDVAFVAESADQNASITVVEEARSEYELENLLAFHQLTVEFYSREVWPDLNSSEPKQGEINALKAVFSKISPTLTLPGDRKLETKGYLMVFENATHYYTITIVSAVPTFEVSEQQLLGILRSFKAK